MTGAQTNALASAGILGEYAAAVLWGAVADAYGPGVVSWCAAALFGVGYSLLGWRFRVSVDMQRHGHELPAGQWIFLCIYYCLAGAGTAASYFGAIIASTKSAPGRHSGLAIGIPCSIFGLSPIFFSALAPLFTTTATSLVRNLALEDASGINDELDPGKWLVFLALLLAIVNVLSGFGLADLSVYNDDALAGGGLPQNGNVAATGSNGQNPITSPVTSDDEDEDDNSDDDDASSDSIRFDADAATERTRLMASSQTLSMSSSLLSLPPPQRQSIVGLLKTPTFWLFGTIIFLSTGPAEMVMASLGGIVEAILAGPPPRTHGILSATARIAGAVQDPRALALRRLHVQVIAFSNTISRLLIGFISDWLSAHPSSEPSADGTKRPARKSRRPKITRLAFVAAACTLLVAAFAFAASIMDRPGQLWILSIAVGVAYGTIFTLSPAIVRAVYHLDHFGRNWGLLTWFAAAGALVFTPLHGILSDAELRKQGPDVVVCHGRGCYSAVMTLSSASALVALVIVGVLYRGSWRGRV